MPGTPDPVAIPADPGGNTRVTIVGVLYDASGGGGGGSGDNTHHGAGGAGGSAEISNPSLHVLLLEGSPGGDHHPFPFAAFGGIAAGMGGKWGGGGGSRGDTTTGAEAGNPGVVILEW